MPLTNKINILSGIVMASIIAMIAFPLYIFFYLDPAFVNFVASSSEREAVKVAHYITLTLFEEAQEFHETWISPDKEVRLTELQHEFEIVKVKIFKPDGTIIYSTERHEVGQVNVHDYFQRTVAKGQTYTKVVQKNTDTLDGQSTPIDVVETYVPIMHGSKFIGAFEIYYDNTTDRNELRDLRNKVSISVALMTLGLVMLVILSYINAGKNIEKKQKAEEALRQAHDDLEARVATRTQQLTEANKALNQEIATRRAAEAEKERLIGELTEALKQVKTLSGLLPICSSCRQIRDDEGKWRRIEDYFQTRTDAEFTHGICPKCAKQLYPDLYDKIDG